MNRENRRMGLKWQKDTLRLTKRDWQVFYIDSDKEDASMHSGRAYTSMHACREGIYTIIWRLPTWLQPLLLPNVTLTPLVTTGAKHLTHTLYLAILLQLQTTNYTSAGTSIEFCFILVTNIQMTLYLTTEPLVLVPLQFATFVLTVSNYTSLLAHL